MKKPVLDEIQRQITRDFPNSTTCARYLLYIESRKMEREIMRTKFGKIIDLMLQKLNKIL